jgi:hypothetical protein
VLLNVAALTELGFVSDATSIRTAWTEDFDSHAMSAFDDDVRPIASAVLSKVGDILPADLVFTRIVQQTTRAATLLRQNIPLSQDARVQDPRAVVAAASSIFRLRPADDHRDRWQAARTHMVEARPPGLLAEEQVAVDRLDDERDRQAGSAQAQAFFDAVDAMPSS